MSPSTYPRSSFWKMWSAWSTLQIRAVRGTLTSCTHGFTHWDVLVAMFAAPDMLPQSRTRVLLVATMIKVGPVDSAGFHGQAWQTSSNNANQRCVSHSRHVYSSSMSPSSRTSSSRHVCGSAKCHNPSLQQPSESCLRTLVCDDVTLCHCLTLSRLLLSTLPW